MKSNAYLYLPMLHLVLSSITLPIEFKICEIEIRFLSVGMTDSHPHVDRCFHGILSMSGKSLVWDCCGGFLPRCRKGICSFSSRF